MRLFRNKLVNNTLKVSYRGGVAQWLGHPRDLKSRGRGFKSRSYRFELELFLGGPWFNQLRFIILLYFSDVCFFQIKWHACELACCSSTHQQL